MGLDLDAVKQIQQEAQVAIDSAQDSNEIEQVRVQFFGKTGLFSQQLKQLGKLPPEERKSFGQQINQIKQTLLGALNEQQEALQQAAAAEKLASETIDVTLPGRAKPQGSLHPVTLTVNRINEYFLSRGFISVEGPELEDDEHNFTALNIPAHHPARAMQDSFYIDPTRLLRTQTTSIQARYMAEHKPPFRIVCSGKTYRNEFDATHTPMFHQYEVMYVDEKVNFANLSALLQDFVSDFFEKEVGIRLRPSYFPFTEPSMEVDITCVSCNGKGCRVCKGTGWLEVLGSGMVHPEVLLKAGFDPEVYQGIAFGVGIERMAMLKYGNNDLRAFYENDIKFLQQYI